MIDSNSLTLNSESQNKETNNLMVLCPVIQAQIIINCEMLDDIGQFTKFILWAVGNDYSINEIDNVIELGNYVIQEEVDYLCKIGFALKDSDKYRLTENGLAYLMLINTVEKVNLMGIGVQINCFSGEVTRSNEVHFLEDNIPEGIYKLPRIVHKQFLNNKNYANSKDFLLRTYPELFEDLTQNQIDSIYVELNWNKETVYVLFELDKVPNAECDYSNILFNQPSVIIKKPIHKCKYTIIDVRLDKYRGILSSLTLLNEFDEELLATRAQKIVVWADEETRMNNTNLWLYIDAFSGEIIETVTNNYIMSRKPVITLPEIQYTLEIEDIRRQLQIENEHWILAEPLIEFTRSTQIIPFSLFSEKGINTNEQ